MERSSPTIYRKPPALRAGNVSLRCALLISAAAAGTSAAGEGIGLAGKVEEFALSNGLRFAVVERGRLPLVAFHLVAGAGWADDPPGQAGVSRLVVRMYGKGTRSLGTRNEALEQKALREVEVAYDRFSLQTGGSPQSLGEREHRRVAFKMAMERAGGFSLGNWFHKVLLFNGASGVSFHVDADTSRIAYTLPSNRAEVFFALTSEWLRNAEFRDFYPERDALAEALSTDLRSSPDARLLRALLETAFASHPYRRLIPPGEELAELRTGAAKAYFRSHYVPSNLTVAVVGDISAAEVRRLAAQYFENLPPAPKPSAAVQQAPAQKQPLRAGVPFQEQTLLQLGWRRPPQGHQDEAAFELLAALLGNEPGGWLRGQLIDEKKMARRLGVSAVYPGGRYPCLFVLSIEPAPGRSLAEVESATLAAIGQLRAAPLSAVLLDAAKARLLAGVYTQLQHDGPLAARLAQPAHAGGARGLFDVLAGIGKLTPEKLHRVAGQYFTPEQSTTVWLSTGAVAAEAAR